MLTRYAASTGAAALTTLGLLVLMSQLIATGRPSLGEARRVEWVPFVVERAPPPPVQRRVRTPEPEAPAEPPDLPRERFGGIGEPAIQVTGPRGPAFERTTTLRSGGMTDGDLLPIVKVQPNYPAAAILRGLEGYVVVEFTVNGLGNVEDIRVVESTNQLFDRAAIEAAARFRYRPRVVDGYPVSVSGVRNLIRFALAGDGRR